MEAEISVIMPVYNSEKYLEEAIESILNQSFSNFEFLIIDDGTTDKSLDIIKKYASKDKRIQWKHRENQGVARTLNELLELSKGKYIARMDADDISHPNRLKRQVKYLKRHQNCACVGSAITIISEGKKQEKRKYCLGASEIRTSMLFQCEFAHPTIMFNRVVLDNMQLKYSLDTKAEDYELWSRLVYNYDCANLSKRLLFYRRHNNNITAISTKQIKDASIQVQEGIFNSFDVDITLSREIKSGANSVEELEKIEKALLTIILKKDKRFWNLWTLRRRVNILYFNTEKNLDFSLNRHKRFWKKFGQLYGGQERIIRIVDVLFFGIKDYFFLN